MYKLDPPVKHKDYFDEVEQEYSYVVVSAVDMPISIADYRTAETMIFPSDGNGVIDWGELVMVPYKSHADALTVLGYEVA
ncbi:hypothetical protein NS184_16915 [Curtobacterium luteum]|uniref:Uncharacterized protein n=1 Tax=Curtobacterium luteum TaxID=33881 RepID=A0A175RFL4_9MICO|nr:hypothetical protein NS184_16915 [Curtobacterium luteum]